MSARISKLVFILMSCTKLVIFKERKEKNHL